MHQEARKLKKHPKQKILRYKNFKPFNKSIKLKKKKKKRGDKGLDLVNGGGSKWASVYMIRNTKGVTAFSYAEGWMMEANE